MATWTLTGFDWLRYRSLAPLLKQALEAGNLRAVRDAEAADLIANLGDISDTEYTCNYVICELCAVGEGLSFHGTFPSFVRYLAATEAGEEASDKLVEGSFGSANVEDWFKAEYGLMGILSWADLDHLRSHLEVLVRQIPRRRETGLKSFVRLLRTAETAEEQAEALLRLVEDCIDRRWGLAFLLHDR